jgi:lysophospholipase L1-like esterase
LARIAAARKAALLHDGVHPNADGHAFLATIIGSFADSL